MVVAIIIMTVGMIMAILVVVVVPVAGATCGRAGQSAVQIAGDKFLHQDARLPGSHFDALLRKQVERTPANAAGDHGADTLRVQPPWEESGHVGRGRHRARGQNGFAPSVGIHQREVRAAAEMAVEPSVSDRNGDFQG